MALEKVKDSKFGVSGNYHRIVNIDIKPKINRVIIIVDLYKDKAARDNNKSPLDSMSFEVKGAQYAAMAAAITQGGSFFAEVASACYAHLKTLPAFSEAADV